MKNQLARRLFVAIALVTSLAIVSCGKVTHQFAFLPNCAPDLQDGPNVVAKVRYKMMVKNAAGTPEAKEQVKKLNEPMEIEAPPKDIVLPVKVELLNESETVLATREISDSELNVENLHGMPESREVHVDFPQTFNEIRPVDPGDFDFYSNAGNRFIDTVAYDEVSSGFRSKKWAPKLKKRRVFLVDQGDVIACNAKLVTPPPPSCNAQLLTAETSEVETFGDFSLERSSFDVSQVTAQSNGTVKFAGIVQGERSIYADRNVLWLGTITSADRKPTRSKVGRTILDEFVAAHRDGYEFYGSSGADDKDSFYSALFTTGFITMRPLDGPVREILKASGFGFDNDQKIGSKSKNFTFTQPPGDILNVDRIVVDNSGNVYMVDRYSYYDGTSFTPMIALRKLAGDKGDLKTNTKWTLSTLVKKTAKDWPISDEMVVADDGTSYIADASEGAIHVVSPTGVLSKRTIKAGAKLGKIGGLAVDACGNLYASESAGNRVVTITPAGDVTTLAGTGKADYKDGKAAEAAFNNPTGLSLDATNNVLYVADTGNRRIRKISVPKPASPACLTFDVVNVSDCDFAGNLQLTSSIDPTGKGWTTPVSSATSAVTQVQINLPAVPSLPLDLKLSVDSGFTVSPASLTVDPADLGKPITLRIDSSCKPAAKTSSLTVFGRLWPVAGQRADQLRVQGLSAAVPMGDVREGRS